MPLFRHCRNARSLSKHYGMRSYHEHPPPSPLPPPPLPQLAAGCKPRVRSVGARGGWSMSNAGVMASSHPHKVRTRPAIRTRPSRMSPVPGIFNCCCHSFIAVRSRLHECAPHVTTPPLYLASCCPSSSTNVNTHNIHKKSHTWNPPQSWIATHGNSGCQAGGRGVDARGGGVLTSCMP